MSATDTGQEPTADHTAETSPEPTDVDSGTTGGSTADTAPRGPEVPPWERDGQSFDPERAWNLIRNLRAEVAEAKRTAARDTDGGDGKASELSRRVEALSSQLARERVARKHELPDELVDLLGDGDEKALAERAEKLIAWRDQTTAEAEPVPLRRPAQKPRGGADPTATPVETDPAKL
ncbi:MAG: hypothetical protein ACRDXX_18125, partial [Stackebrandtia sp.]